MPASSSSEAITLRPLTAADTDTIMSFPPYPPPYHPLDYALRRGGWLDQFPESHETRRFGIWRGADLVGFSLLTHIAEARAEFYVAIHPKFLGQRIGEAATQATLAYGFESLALDAIDLKVRTWHRHGQHLYEKSGFVVVGEKSETIQGQPERFVLMEITRARWRARAGSNG